MRGYAFFRRFLIAVPAAVGTPDCPICCQTLSVVCEIAIMEARESERDRECPTAHRG